MARFYKKSLFLLSLITFHLSLLTSCQEGGDAGDLLGQWRLSGSDTQYISFSGSIVWMKNLKENELYGNFQHVGDSIFIQCVSTESLPSDTLLIEQDFGFKPFTDIRLKIDQLDSDRLLLSKDGRQWVFTKW